MIELIKNDVFLQVVFVIYLGLFLYFILDIIWAKRIKEYNNEGVIHREFNLEDLYYQPKVIDSFRPDVRKPLVTRRQNYQSKRLRMYRGGRS